jgi:hypothetical protein
MPAVRAVDTEIYADHAQFYLVDATAAYRADLVWDSSGLQRHLGVSEGIVAIGTIGYTFLPVRLELWDEEPPSDADEWDHVVEASLDVPSGRLGLHTVDGPIEGDNSFAVEPGRYRVRSSAAGLDHADEMDGGDSYRVQVWPAPASDPRVLVWWPPWREQEPPPDVAPPGQPPRGVLERPSVAAMVRNVWQTWRYSRGWRPPQDR